MNARSVSLALDMLQSWLSGWAGLVVMILMSRLEDQDMSQFSDFNVVADLAHTADLDKCATDPRASSLTDLCMTPS